MARRKAKGPDVRIEYPSTGATYSRNEYGVYEYGTYPRHSVLAGMESRTFLDSFKTLDEAKAAFPEASVITGSCFAPLNLDFLPDEDDPRNDSW
jgi:hypothetical protein